MLSCAVIVMVDCGGNSRDIRRHQILLGLARYKYNLYFFFFQQNIYLRVISFFDVLAFFCCPCDFVFCFFFVESLIKIFVIAVVIMRLEFWTTSTKVRTKTTFGTQKKNNVLLIGFGSKPKTTVVKFISTIISSLDEGVSTQFVRVRTYVF